jgi:hypothetical protein
LVEHHRNVLVLADGRCKAIDEQLHRLGVDVGQDQGEGVVGSGLDRCEDVGEREPLVGEPTWPLAAFPPDMASAAFLADPCLVLEEDADALFRAPTD